MSNAPTIRLATAADVGVVHELLQHLAESLGQRSKFRSRTEDFLQYGFSGDEHFHVLLAEQDEVAVGLTLFFYNYSSWLGELGVYIQDIVVTSEARTGGVGQRLIRETARYAQQHGAAHLRLSVDRGNPGAMRFYEKIGLRERTDECIYAAYDSDFQSLVETQ